MSTVADKDLKELRDLINSKFDSISKDINEIKKDINEIKVDVATIKSDVNGLGKRLDNLEFTNRGIFITVVSGLLLATRTLIVKFLVPPMG